MILSVQLDLCTTPLPWYAYLSPQIVEPFWHGDPFLQVSSCLRAYLGSWGYNIYGRWREHMGHALPIRGASAKAGE